MMLVSSPKKKGFLGKYLTKGGFIKDLSLLIGKMKICYVVTGEKTGGSHPELIVCAVFNKVGA